MGEAIITRRTTVIDNALVVREFTFAATDWAESAENGYYTQPIVSDLITEHTVIEIFLETETLRQFMDDGVTAIFAKNDGGNAEIVALGAAPTADIVLQISFTETDLNENTSV